MAKDLLAELKKKHTPSDKKEREARLKVRWDYAAEGRKPIEKIMMINQSYYLGNQWIGWSDSAFSVKTIPAPSHRIRVTDNRLAPKIRAKIARQMGRVGLQVMPESSDELDIARAKVKERVINHIARENHIEHIQHEMSLWAAVCGDCYVSVVWNPEGGDSYETDEGEYNEGEVRILVYSPWEVWEDANARSDNFGRYCFTGRLFPTEYVETEFADALSAAGIDKITTDGDEYINKYASDALHGMFSQIANQTAGYTKNKSEDLTMVKTYYEFPHKGDPQGKEVVLINDRIVDEKPLDWFPLVHYSNLLYFSRHRGDTEIRQAIPLQKNYNRSRSSIEEYIKVMAKGKWLEPETAKTASSSINSEHGEIIRYKGVQPPTPISVPSLPADIWRQLDSYDRSIDDLFADRPVSQGRSEHSGQPARAIQMLQEEDDRLHGPSVILFETAMRKVFEKSLVLASRHYQQDRKLMIIGDDQRPSIEQLDRGEGGNDSVDELGGTHRVYIALGSSLPKNKAARANMVLTFYREGLYDPNNPMAKKVLKMIDAGVVEDVFDVKHGHEMKAKKENQAMLNGITVEINPWDDHVVHYEEHSKVLVSRDYDDATKDVQNILQAHVALTVQELAALMPPPEGEEGEPANNSPAGAASPTGEPLANEGSLSGQPDIVGAGETGA